MNKQYGIFTVSLDFELYWGMRDVVSIDAYAENMDGVPEAIDMMLEKFDAYGVHATWAIVGFLYFSDREKLIEHSPEVRPKYLNRDYDLYDYVESHTSLESAYHFAPDSIRKISAYPKQEIGTHTFSHYYCLEEGQSREVFKSDLQAAVKTAREHLGIDTRSLVFPRNQWNKEYLPVLSEVDIVSYRGNENGWVYRAGGRDQISLFKRGVKLLDSYINLTGYHTYRLKDLNSSAPYNIPASRFLRPAKKSFSILEKLRLERITRSMTYAAKNGEIFHLWWHPHNFGKDIEANELFLRKILEHYGNLKAKYHMKSLNMGEIATILEEI